MRISEILNELDFPRKKVSTPSSKIEHDPDVGNWTLALSKLPMKMPAVTGADEKFVAKLTHKRKKDTVIYGVGDTQEEAKANALSKLAPRELGDPNTLYKSVTADLNAPFTKEYLKGDASLWFKFTKYNGEPAMIMANRDYVNSFGAEIKELGFTKASKGRTAITGDATPIWGFPISKSVMSTVGLIPNMRYTLEYTTDDNDGNAIFVMNPDSKTQGPQDKYRMGVPGVTIAATAMNEDWEDEDDLDDPERMAEMYIKEMQYGIDDIDVEHFAENYREAEVHIGQEDLINQLARYISPADESKEHLLKLLLGTIKYELEDDFVASIGLFDAIKKNNVNWPELKVIEKSLKKDLSEDKIKGVDGKRCWDNYRYAGKEKKSDGTFKDKCVKVKKSK